jgi:hypothetical protein
MLISGCFLFATETSSAEGGDADENGVIYGAEFGQKDLKKCLEN